MAVLSVSQTIVDRAVSEFVAKSDVLKAMTRFTPQTPVTLGSVVVVPYVTGSATTFTRAVGYSIDSGTGAVGANGVSVTCNWNPISSVVINDPSLNVLTEDFLVKAVANARDQVLRNLASASFALFTTANFATSTAYSASATAVPLGYNNPAAIGDLIAKTVDWTGQKFVVAGATLNTALHAPYISGSTVVTVTNKQLLASYPDISVINTSLGFQAGMNGAVIGDGAIALVTGLKNPPAGQTTTKFIPMMVPELPGVVLAYREFYSDNTGELVSVIEAVAGAAKINGSAGLFIP